MKLYEIDAEIDRILEEVEEGQGLLTEIIESKLQKLELARGTKLENIIYIIKEEEARLEAIEKEAGRLKALKNRTLNKIDWLQGYIGRSLGEGNNYDGGTFKVKWRTSKQAEVFNLDLLPNIYKRQIVKVEPDKLAIKKDIESGVDIPGARILEKQNIQIK